MLSMESSLIKLNYWKDVWWIVALPTINNSSKWTCLRKSIVWKRCSSFSYALSQKENLVSPLEKRRNFEFSKITLPKKIFLRMMENNWTNNWILNGDWVMFCTFSFLLKILSNFDCLTVKNSSISTLTGDNLMGFCSSVFNLGFDRW